MKIKAFLLGLAVVTASCSGNQDEPGRTASFQGTIDTFAGTTFGYDGDGGKARQAKLGWVIWVSVDNTGNILVTDGAANTIRKITAAGDISTIAGKFIGFNVINLNQYSGDGGPATMANLNVPLAAASDGAGNLFISDAGNNVLRKVDVNGQITTLAGKVLQGNTGDNGPATQALINGPAGMATDSQGNLYFADKQNHIIRRISTTGIITTIAGTPGVAGYSGDGGPATAAKLSEPAAVAIDATGNIYISDNNSTVRRISTAGKISTIAGTAQPGYSGDGGPALDAMLQAPKAIAIAPDGSILVADSGNNRIRRITPESGMIETIAGTGVAGYSGDGGLAVDAQLSNPQGLAVDGTGNIYVAESGSSVIRVIRWID